MNSAITSSSNEATKAKAAPDSTPGRINGSITRRNAVTGRAPEIAAARISVRSKLARLAPTVTTTNGEAIVVCAMMMPANVLASPSRA